MTVAGTGAASKGAWLEMARQRLADAAGQSPVEFNLEAGDVDAILRLAREAAHGSGDRTNAPLVAYLVGVARGRHPERSVGDLVTAVCGPQDE
jgi:hypothetical protein